MKTKIFTLLIIAISIVAYSQEIPNLTFTQSFDYPENDPQDGSTGSVLSPDYWTEYNGFKNISYIAVTSSNEIPIASGTAKVFRIYVPPYVQKVSIGINGPDGLATQFMRVASIDEDIENATIPTNYTAGSLSDSQWQWLGSTGNYIYTREAQYNTTGSAMFFVIYNGANVDDNYDGVPEGDYPNTLTVGSFTMSWSIPLADTTNYIDWANGASTEIIYTNSDSNNFIVYPNPVSNNLHLSVNNIKQTEKIQILDLTGEVLKQSKTSISTESVINVENIPNGVYFVKVGNTIKKFIKE